MKLYCAQLILFRKKINKYWKILFQHICIVGVFVGKNVTLATRADRLQLTHLTEPQKVFFHKNIFKSPSLERAVHFCCKKTNNCI